MAGASSQALEARAAASGVATTYEDAWGRARRVPADTVAAVLEALADGPGPPPAMADDAPRRCHLRPGMHTWGWAAQLYGLRSASSWGIGDLGDLKRLAEWSAGEAGAGVLLISPLHAGAMAPRLEPSPYSPSTRRFRHPIYLAVEGAPPSLWDSESIDRDRAWSLKLPALERQWAVFGGSDEFDGFVSAGGRALEDYAVFCVLEETFASGWRAWPPAYRRPRTAAVTRFARERHDRVRFFQWLQWLLELQLSQVTSRIALVQDLAVGFSADGVDAWALQDFVAPGMRLGAPPDAFNPDGQDWQLPAMDPWRMRAAGYEPWAEAVRANLARSGGVRIDHVLGLFRMYWIPEGADARAGTYVRYPYNELLNVLACESQRAGAFVVGEDLGTVPPFVRDELQRRDILSYRLYWFEEVEPRRYPWRSLAAVTTHDLPTIAGVLAGSDAPADLVARLAPFAACGGDAEVVAEVYRRLAEAPSAVLAVSLEDVTRAAERPNNPGVPDPGNWSRPLPERLEDLVADPVVGRVAQIMRERET